MDIRKFFGAPKASSGSKQQSSQSTTKSKTDEKVKDKLSKYQKDEPIKTSGRVKTDKAPKKPVSKLKSNGKSEENIVIADSSDDDVIPSSLEVKKSSKNKNSNNASDKSRTPHVSKPVISAKGTKGGESKGKAQAERSSPRKGKTGKENGKDTSRDLQKKKDCEESPEVSIVMDVSSEDDEVIVSKNTSGSKRKRVKRAAMILDSDSGDDDDSISERTPKNKRKRKSIGHMVHDSDEEKVETPMDKFIKKKTTSVETKSTKKEVPKKPPVNVMDFFGTNSVSVSRVERPKPAEKRKRNEVTDEKDKGIVFEEELHDDEDFLKVLDELDGPNVKKVKVSHSKEEEDETVGSANTVTGKGGSLASKLANRMKGEPIETKKEEEAATKRVVSTSPPKKSPQKPMISPKRSKTELIIEKKSNDSTPLKTESKREERSTPKASATPKSATKGEKDEDDDGFGTKKASSFRAFKMRGGPQALGSKEIPEGAENCLEGLTFVITGVLDSIERDDVKCLVEKYGGKVTTSLSKKTGYLVVGREPGDSKLSKAKDLKIKQIDEDGLFDLLGTLPAKTSKYELQAKEQIKKEKSFKSQTEAQTSSAKLDSSQNSKDKPTFTRLKSSDLKEEKTPKKEAMKGSGKPSGPNDSGVESLLWVDKHKPTTMKQIIGQQGDKSNAHKLLQWIQAWHKSIIVKGMKASGNFFGKGGGDGAGFRAALLSGPPGIGKTTTATLVCKEARFSYVELNASDTRSKRSLKEVVAEALNNQTLVDFVGEESKGRSQHSQQHHCLIMDEVDGMAGNEDRGGLQELVQLIKGSKIPIICICNDRNSMKMRTLANYCFDLRFQRPRVEQIKGAMMTLAFREGVKIPAPAVQEIILASNHDIRQIIHNLSMWSVAEKTLSFEQVKADAQKARKDMKMGPFDVCRKVFVSDEETRKMSIHDKSDLFFHDYSFASLFVHENYPHVIPSRAEGKKSKHLACLAHTIDSLCDGDLIEKRIRSEGNWNLLPAQAMYSSVIPGEIMRGSFPQMTAFPSWLGKNSSRGKMDRILQELGSHMSLKVSCDKRGLNQDYLPALRTCLTSPLVTHGTDGVPGIIQMMNDYDIIKDDFDNILEVSKWPNSVDNMARVESKTKAALTRMYNKSGHMTPYSTGQGGKKKRGQAADADDLLREEGEEDAVVESEQEEDDTPAVVAKPKQTKGKAAKGNSQGKPKVKGKGRK